MKLKVKHTYNPNFPPAPVTGSDVNVSSLTQVTETDYVGNKVYENGVLKRVLIDGGYIEGGTYYFYVNDHLGNNRAVARADGPIFQRNHYYPFGMAFADSYNSNIQPYKYNGKELDRKHGLNLYDYSARYYDQAIGRFTTVDPLAEKYYSISPYAYVANNPMRLIDPTGMTTEFFDEPKKTKGGILDEILRTINQVGQEILNTVGLSNDQLQSENPIVREDASQKRQEAAETIHTVNETMVSVAPGGDLVYKAAFDREITGGEVAWAAAGATPVGKVGKGAKVITKGSTIWTKTKNASAVQNAFRHAKDHGKEFPQFLNKKQYVEGAKDFLHNSPSGTLVKTRSNGDILKYDPNTNTYGVMDATGVPRTMFKPTDGIKYWNRQK